MSIESNLSKLELDQDIGTVFSTLRPNQDKRKSNCKKTQRHIKTTVTKLTVTPTITGYELLI
jgi:hypothetical protein